MRNILFKYFALAAIFVAVGVFYSCEKTSEAADAEFVDITVYCGADEASKVAVSEKHDDSGLSLAWEEGDCLIVRGNTTEKFTLKDIDGNKATFTGRRVEGSTFDVILTRSGDFLSRSYLSQTQQGVSSTAHLLYDACLKGVSTYTDVFFTEEWAMENGGRLLQSGTLLLHFQLPVAASLVTSVSLQSQSADFYATNDPSGEKHSLISLSITDGQVGADNQVKAYVMTSAAQADIDAGAVMRLKVETDRGIYVKDFIPGRFSLVPGKRNVIRLNSRNWLPVVEYKDLTLMSYNIGSFLKYKTDLGHYSYPEAAVVVNHYSVDVIGMNETDNGMTRSENQYQAEVFARELGSGWKYYFAYALDTYYGNSILSSGRFAEVKRWPRLELPKGDGYETRSLGAIEYDDFVFCVAHLDHKSNTARLNAVQIINDWAQANYASSDKPVFLVGDMNCTPDDPTIGSLLEKWTRISSDGYTFSTASPSKCIDYIFVLNNEAEYEVNASDVITSCPGVTVSKISDHFPIYADLTLIKRYPENDNFSQHIQGSVNPLPDNSLYEEEF